MHARGGALLKHSWACLKKPFQASACGIIVGICNTTSDPPGWAAIHCVLPPATQWLNYHCCKHLQLLRQLFLA